MKRQEKYGSKKRSEKKNMEAKQREKKNTEVKRKIRKRNLKCEMRRGNKIDAKFLLKHANRQRNVSQL
jgi:hypothetical protein